MQWLEDKLDATGWRLDELVWEFNRYNLRQIVIDDPQIASRSFGMTLQLKSVDDFTKALMTEGITVTRVPEEGGASWSYHLRGALRRGRERGK
jgi:ferric-dicitrate binding protein FerR (iron transport regulator)